MQLWKPIQLWKPTPMTCSHLQCHETVKATIHHQTETARCGLPAQALPSHPLLPILRLQGAPQPSFLLPLFAPLPSQTHRNEGCMVMMTRTYIKSDSTLSNREYQFVYLLLTGAVPCWSGLFNSRPRFQIQAIFSVRPRRQPNNY